MNNQKEIFEKIAEVKEEVLLGDVVKVLRALNEDIDDVIEVTSSESRISQKSWLRIFSNTSQNKAQ